MASAQSDIPAGDCDPQHGAGFYFDKEGLLRRQDYNVDVLGGAPSANYASEYKKFSGLVIPTRRRVYRCRPDDQPVFDSVIVAIDFHEIKVD